MKFTCDRSALVDKLDVLARGVSTRSALPVLSGILLQAAEGRLDLFSTDMELSIKANLATPVERDGEIVVPARLFTRRRPQPARRRGASSRPARRRSRSAPAAPRSRSTPGSASDFPQTSTFDMSGAFTVGREPFVETLNKVGRAASRDETRPILTGVLMTIMGDTLKMVATDSYRLAVKETKLDHALDDRGPGDRPGQGARRGRASRGVDGRRRHRGRHRREPGRLQAQRPGGDVWVASRLIDGQFPNYKQLLPDTFDHEVTLDRGRAHGGGAARQPAGAEERAAAPVVRRATGSR